MTPHWGWASENGGGGVGEVIDVVTMGFYILHFL